MVFKLLWMIKKTFEHHFDMVRLKFAIGDYGSRIDSL